MDGDAGTEWSERRLRKIEQLRQKVKKDKTIVFSEEFQKWKEARDSH